jgi:hypothetical protein
MVQQNSVWKLMFLVVFLVLFAAIGIGHVVKPDWFIKRSGIRKGGEMLTEWHRLQFRIMGAVLAGFATYALYVLLRDYVSHW